MPSLKVDQIKQVLKGGVRSNLFQITVNRTASGINVPALPFGDNGQNLSVLVRSWSNSSPLPLHQSKFLSVEPDSRQLAREHSSHGP